MKIFFSMVILVGGALTLLAQQEGAVAIASAIRSEPDTTTQNFTDCVGKLVEAGLPAKDASRECKEVTKIVAKTTMRVANEAADATKASRPVVVNPYGGYGYAVGYRYRYSGRGVVREPRYRRPQWRRR